MHRFMVSLSLAFVMLLGLLALHAQPVAVAQEATPSTDMGPEGTTFVPLGFVQGVTWPSPADVFVVRFHIDAGTSFPLDPSDPTNTVLVVESGSFTVRVEEMAWSVTRGEALSAAMETGDDAGFEASLEEVAMGAEATLAAGDVAYVPGSVNGEVRNDGQEAAEALLFVVGPPEAMLSATPEP